MGIREGQGGRVGEEGRGPSRHVRTRRYCLFDGGDVWSEFRSRRYEAVQKRPNQQIPTETPKTKRICSPGEPVTPLMLAPLTCSVLVADGTDLSLWKSRLLRRRTCDVQNCVVLTVTTRCPFPAGRRSDEYISRPGRLLERDEAWRGRVIPLDNYKAVDQVDPYSPIRISSSSSYT